MSTWVAIAFGALDLRGSEYEAEGFEIVAVPAIPGPPAFLFGEGAAVWRTLLAGPVDDRTLTERDREIVHDLAGMGLASKRTEDPARMWSIAEPWLISVFHELVYALVARVATAHGIDILFIKGPTLHAQGLRDREHSGDVDCWVRSGDDRRLAKAMEPWGWTPLILPFTGTTITHSLTLVVGEWGCAVDVHSSYPGIGVAPAEAFKVLLADSEDRVFAGVTVRTPRDPAHAVIAALHDMRPFEGAMPAAGLVRNAESMLRHGGERVLSVVDRLDAGYVLRVPLERAFGADASRFAAAQPPRDWEMRLETSTSRRHFRALRLVPVLHRPRTLYRLIWPRLATMRISMGDPSASTSTVLRARLRRIGVSIRKLIDRR